MKVQIPKKFRGLFKPKRYKVFYGGRGSAKSWSVAAALVMLALNGKHTILCTREIQNSISDSVLKLLEDTIERLGVRDYFWVGKTEIVCTLTGSRFIFKGLHSNLTKLKSLEGVDVVWIEEAEKISQDSLDILLPTIRKGGSEVWVTFNPEFAEDPIYRMFIVEGRPDALVVKVNWYDNQWFSDELMAELEWDREHDPDKYSWKWEGNCKTVSDSQVFKGRWSVKSFAIPEENTDWIVGMDFGFAEDPTAVIRGFIKDNTLYLSHEVYAYGATYDELPELLGHVLPRKDWPVTADSARPDTIAHLRSRGFCVKGAKKGKGSVNDGIERLKGFDQIVLHPSLKSTIEEFRNYSYKKNRHTGEILPEPEDKNNHIIDALRYATEGLRSKASFIAWSDF